MNITEIKELLRVIKELNLDTVKLETSDIKLEVLSNGLDSINRVVNSKENISNQIEVVNDNTIISTETEAINVEDNLTVIQSPIMGTFYSASSPDSPPFVSVGDKVNVGDKLCIVEAMKLMNEVTSDIEGTIVEIVAKNEDLVEYNQPLFKIKPSN